MADRHVGVVTTYEVHKVGRDLMYGREMCCRY